MTRKEWRGLTSFGVILLIFCASFVIGIGAAAASPSASINPMATSGLNQNDVFQVTVEVDSDTNDLSSLDMNLFYDSSALQVNSITEDGLLGGSILIAPGSGDDGAGTISYAIASTAGTYSPKSGTFITIVFQVKAAAAAGTYNLNLDNVEFLDDVDDVIPGVVVTDGTATVVGTPSTSNPTVKVDPIATSGLNQNDVFQVMVDVDSGTNDLSSLDMNLFYDSSALQVNSITEDGLLGGSILIAPGSGDDGAGTISYAIASTAGTYSPESGTFITIVFQVKAAAAAGTYDLDLANVEFLDDVDDVIPGVVVTDGTATVVGTPSTSNPTVKVNPMASSGEPSDIFQVMVDVDSGTNDLSSLDMNLFYDSSALQVNSITEEGLLGGSILIAPGSGDDGAGTISYGIASTAGTYSPESGTFITIVFQIKDTAAVGTYNLNLDNVVLLDDVDDVILGVVVTDGTVDVGYFASAVRTLPASVERGEQFTVSMDVSEYGTTGTLVETIPVGFTYVSSTIGATVVNEMVTFALGGETSFEYDVTASNTEGPYSFSGMLTDDSANDVVVSGDTLIDVLLPDGIVLMSGWNFISVPFELNNSSTANVFTGVDYTVLTYYDASASLWVGVTTIDPLKGYWIKIPEDIDTQVILQEVLAIKPNTVPAQLQLYVGWNCIGHSSIDVLSAEFTLDSIDDSYDSIWGPWKSDTMSYEYIGHNGVTGVITGRHVGTDIFEMSPYNGYWVYMTQEDILRAIG